MKPVLPVLLLVSGPLLLTPLESCRTACGADGNRVIDGGPSQDTKAVRQRGVIQGSGKVITITKQLEPFRSIEIHAGDQLEIIQGRGNTLTIEAEDNIQPLLQTTVDGGRLRLNWKTPAGTSLSSRVITVNGRKIIFPGGVKNISIINGQVTVNGVNINDSSLTSIQPRKRIAYRLTVLDLDQVTASQTVRVTCQSLQTQSLGLTVSGSSQISFSKLQAKMVEARVSGSGQISLIGQAPQQAFRVSGSGLVDARRLAGKAARIKVTGSGDVKTAVTESLDVNISGSGDVTYSGSPKIVRKISGSGKLIKSGNEP